MPKDTNYPCAYCEFTSKYKHTVTRHIKLVHEKRRDYKCSMCSYAAGSAQSLGWHVKAQHEHMRDNVCSECDYRTSAKHNLVAHVKIVHRNIKEHECSRCGHKCATNNLLQRHIEANHTEPAEKSPDGEHNDKTTCLICGFESSKISELAIHEDFVVCFACLYAWTKNENRADESLRS